MADIILNDDPNVFSAPNTSDSIFANGGDDEIYGNKGNDSIDGGTGNDHLFGGPGSDILWGQTGDDQLNGAAGYDTIYGGGNDLINGGQNADLLYGDDGNDRIYTGGGEDTAWGGSGDDTIVDFYSTSGTEYFHGGDGNDHIFNTGNGNVSPVGPYGPPTEYLMYGDDGNDTLQIQYAVGTLDGGTGNDKLFLAGFDRDRHRRRCNDVIYGAAKESIYDVANFDRDSPGGLQIFDGGLGNDTMYAYDYTLDRFIFRPGDGRDVITNFNTDADYAPADQIDLTAFGLSGMTQQQIIDRYGTERNGDLILRFDATSTIVLKDMTADAMVGHLII